MSKLSRVLRPSDHHLGFFPSSIFGGIWVMVSTPSPDRQGELGSSSAICQSKYSWGYTIHVTLCLTSVATGTLSGCRQADKPDGKLSMLVIMLGVPILLDRDSKPNPFLRLVFVALVASVSFSL